jgi:hypothetical protein
MLCRPLNHQTGTGMKVIAHLISLGFPDTNPAQVSAAICLSVTYLKTGLDKVRHTVSHN